jgi:uncharacterized protein with ATP-grasp and redox domains
MKSALDCIPCFVAQALNVARLTTDDPQVHERILREALRRASEADLAQSPALFGRDMHRWVRELTRQADPYLAVKQESNRLALALLPAWRERLRAAENPRLAAVKLAVAANVIDFGIKGDLTAEQIPAALESSFAAPLMGDVEGLFAAAERATDILFLADNAGELVFDRLLLELLPRQKITVVVKGGPAINDALLADAQVAGLEGLVAVMDTGSDGAGIVLEACSLEFQRRFARADLIIAKGQANFESLDGCGQNIFFLFKVKCPVVARHIGQAVGSLVLHPNVPETAGRGAVPPPTEAREPNSTTENKIKRKDKIMTPMGDGTGPLGQGPGAGKGMGPCGGGQRRGWGGGRGQGGQGRGRGFGRGRGQGGMMQQNLTPPSNPDANKPNKLGDAS